MATDEQILKTINKLAPVSVEDVALALRDDQGSVRQKMQRLRRSGLVQVAQRKQIQSRVKCYYELTPKPEMKKKDFEGYMSVIQIARFQKSVRGTPWAQMGFLL